MPGVVSYYTGPLCLAIRIQTRVDGLGTWTWDVARRDGNSCIGSIENVKKQGETKPKPQRCNRTLRKTRHQRLPTKPLGPAISQWGYSSGAEFAFAVECSSEQMHLCVFRPAGRVLLLEKRPGSLHNYGGEAKIPRCFRCREAAATKTWMAWIEPQGETQARD